MFLQVLNIVMRALTWESSCTIANTFEKHSKSICQGYVSALL